MTGWLIALGILVLIAILPIGASLIYDEDGLLLSLLLGWLKIRLYPKKQTKEKKPKEKKKTARPTREKKAPPKPKEKSGGKLTDFLPLVEVGLQFLDSLRRKLRLNRLELKLTMAGGDPCNLAVNYGRAWAAAGNLIPLLERIFVIRKRDIQVQCDFTVSETLVAARLDITITVGRILGIAVKYGVKALLELMKIKRKGGIDHE